MALSSLIVSVCPAAFVVTESTFVAKVTGPVAKARLSSPPETRSVPADCEMVPAELSVTDVVPVMLCDNVMSLPALIVVVNERLSTVMFELVVMSPNVLTVND